MVDKEINTEASLSELAKPCLKNKTTTENSATKGAGEMIQLKISLLYQGPDLVSSFYLRQLTIIYNSSSRTSYTLF